MSLPGRSLPYAIGMDTRVSHGRDRQRATHKGRPSFSKAAIQSPWRDELRLTGDAVYSSQHCHAFEAGWRSRDEAMRPRLEDR